MFAGPLTVIVILAVVMNHGVHTVVAVVTTHVERVDASTLAAVPAVVLAVRIVIWRITQPVANPPRKASAVGESVVFAVTIDRRVHAVVANHPARMDRVDTRALAAVPAVILAVGIVIRRVAPPVACPPGTTSAGGGG